MHYMVVCDIIPKRGEFMYSMLTLLTGFILAIMITLNGQLAQSTNLYFAIVVIHIVGVLFAYLLCKFKKIRLDIFKVKQKWLYLGGLIGVFTTIANNIAFGQISMTSIIALGLLGQLVISLFIDSFGLFHMEKRPLKKSNVVVLVFSLIGISMMLDNSVLVGKIAVFISITSGVAVLLNRTINARLAEKVGDLPSSLINHLVGLPVTIIIATIAVFSHVIPNQIILPNNPIIYLGGALGVLVVFLSNITVMKVPAFKLTVLVFISQIFMGVCIDLVLGLSVNNTSFIGGLLISLGILLELVYSKLQMNKKILQSNE